MLLLNGKKVEFVEYPNGETLLRPETNVDRRDATYTIELYFENDADLFRLQMLADHIDDIYDQTYGVGEQHTLNLDIPYMPYSRADRSQNGSVFTLKHVCRMINNMHFDHVTVYEPHSDATMKLLYNASQVNTTVNLLPYVMKNIDFRWDIDYLVFPDEGAQKRYSAQSEIFDQVNVLAATKTRDFDTGKILNIEFKDKPHTEVGLYSQAIIVDDLSARGGTFVWTADLLRKMGFTKVHLLVTHFENVGYNNTLFDAMDSIWVADTMVTDQSKWPDKDTVDLSKIACMPKEGFDE